MEKEQLHVTVDHQQCQGAGYCERVAPLVFRLGDDTLSHVIDSHPPESERDAVEEAATLCPSRAIRY
ncbi:MAG: ferredoxin [bacterium]|nr:ferredoxin [bacterium]